MSDSIPQDMLQRIIRQHPQVAETIHVVREISSKADFPIPSYQNLVDSMGGPEATLHLGGRRYTFAELEHHVPSYYFPIGNENDLIAKMGDLAKRVPSAASESTYSTQAMNINAVLLPATAARPSSHAPTHSLEEFHRLAGTTLKAAPGTGGISR